MICDATGLVGTERFKLLEKALDAFWDLNTDETLTVNKTVGNGVLDHLEKYLHDSHPLEMMKERISLGYGHPDMEHFVHISTNVDFVIIDEAENLKNYPEVQRAVDLYKDQVKYIFVVTVPYNPESEQTG